MICGGGFQSKPTMRSRSSSILIAYSLGKLNVEGLSEFEEKFKRTKVTHDVRVILTPSKLLESIISVELRILYSSRSELYNRKLEIRNHDAHRIRWLKYAFCNDSSIAILTCAQNEST